MKAGILAFFVGFAAVTALSVADAGSGQPMNARAVAEHIFTHADADKDGAMTPDEYARGGLGKYGAKFADFDLDDDGRVTRAEYHEVFNRFHSGIRRQAI